MIEKVMKQREIHKKCLGCALFLLNYCEGLAPMNKKAKDVLEKGFEPECYTDSFCTALAMMYGDLT